MFRAWSQEPSFNIPLDHPVYILIDMLALPSVTGKVSLSNRPYTAAQVCTLLTNAKYNKGSAAEKIINSYLEEFNGNNISKVKKLIVPIDEENTFAFPYIETDLRFEDSGFTKSGFNAVSIDTFPFSPEPANKTVMGGKLYSNVFGFLINFDGSIITEYGSKEQWQKINDPSTGRNYTTIMAKDNQPGRFIGYDAFCAYVKPPLKWLDMEFGYDRVSWGYAGSSGLLLSGEGRPFLLSRASAEIGRLDYTFILGKLTASTYEQTPLLYAKHMSFSPIPNVAVGLSDAIISDDRSLKPAYFLPFVPYYFIDHYMSGRDNRIISFDAHCLIKNRISFYTELMIDEITNLLGFISNNKANDIWGGLLGVKWHNPIPRLPFSSLKLEFVQIEPWAYTRYAFPGEQQHNNPVDFGRPLGNQMGPHSRSFLVDLSAIFNEKLYGSFSVTHFIKAAGPGSTIFDGNDFVYDTLNGEPVIRQLFTEKEYRFRNYVKNRAVVSINGKYTIHCWLQLSLFGDLIFDHVPIKETSFRIGTALKFNY